MKGCLILLAVFATAFGLESMAIDALNLPHARITALLLAMGVTLLLAVFREYWKLGEPKPHPRLIPFPWDGQTVRIGGVLYLGPAVAVAPFSGRESCRLATTPRAPTLGRGEPAVQALFPGV